MIPFVQFCNQDIFVEVPYHLATSNKAISPTSITRYALSKVQIDRSDQSHRLVHPSDASQMVSPAGQKEILNDS
jgi:hypothetical protein